MADRGTTKERGYGAEHKAEKERWRPLVDAGETYCAETICLEDNDGNGRHIQPGTPWHLAHDDGQQGYRGPAHARCNISEASRRMHAARAAQTAPTSGESLWWRP